MLRAHPGRRAAQANPEARTAIDADPRCGLNPGREPAMVAIAPPMLAVSRAIAEQRGARAERSAVHEGYAAHAAERKNPVAT